MATGNATGQAPTIPAGPTAKESAPIFGGLRGGRKRDDGLIPGSPEALEADRKKDRDRKAKERAEKTVAQPPALPAATGSNPIAAPVALQNGQPVVSLCEVVPWTTEMLKGPTQDFVDLCEQLDVENASDQAKELALQSELVKEIEREAHWPKLGKKSIVDYAPALAAKWLNKWGISSQNKEEIFLGAALLSILRSRSSVKKRIANLEQAKKTTAGVAAKAGVAAGAKN